MSTTIRLQAGYVQKIKENPALQGLIAQSTGRSTNAVWRWCSHNSPQLTLLSVLICIREFLKLPKEAVLTEQVNIADRIPLRSGSLPQDSNPESCGAMV